MNILKNHKKRKGFSLIELIVVILIIAILALAVFAGGSAAIKKSQIARTTSDLHNFSIAIESAMNETPSVANITAVSGMTGTIVKAVNDNLSADYQLHRVTAKPTGNLRLIQGTTDTTDTFVVYESDKTDAWGNPYYVVFDATERHSAGISEFYVTVVSAGPNAQTNISRKGTDVTGIEADDLFLLVQYTDGDVAAVTYNCSTDALANGADTQVTLNKTTKGAVAASNQGYYVGLAADLSSDGTDAMCPVNFQPAA